MTSRVTRGFVQSFKKRLLATQAATRADHSEVESLLRCQETKLSRLPNGIVVVSQENYSPISRVGVVINAGPRFEDSHNFGVSHCLRAAAGLSTKDVTKFGITRTLQQIGATLTCSASRENMYYIGESLRDDSDVVLQSIREIITAPDFQPWEVKDMQPRLSLDLALLQEQPNIRLHELVHKAAFRSTLGNSLYAPKYMIGQYSSDQLMNYLKTYYSSGRMAVVGLGVDHDDLVEKASKFTPFSSSGVTPEKASYQGGEIREESRSLLTYAAVVTEGASLGGNDLLACAILQQVMGAGPSVKYSNNACVSRIGQAAVQATNQPVAVNTINVSYSDGGMFGFSAVAQPEDMGNVLKAVFKQFAGVTKGGITDAEIARAKNQLKTAIHFRWESGTDFLVDLGDIALGHGELINVETMEKTIDSISTADIVNVSKRVINAKPSMAAIGDLSHTPYLDQLYK